MIYADGPCQATFWGVKAHMHTFIWNLRDLDMENSNHGLSVNLSLDISQTYYLFNRNVLCKTLKPFHKRWI